MAIKLVIVESPAKTRTISSILGKEFKVVASMGHIIDLPKNRFGVFIDEKDIKINYTQIAEKKKIIDMLKTEMENADTVFLATDPDREGEAIAYHISTLSPDTHFKRVMINEITVAGIKNGFKHPSELDMDKVNSQQGRRLLDRIVGYKLSPFLWQKVKKGLSAGRVQSVALRMICEREELILAFVPEKYWEIFAQFDFASAVDFKLSKIGKKKAEIKDQKLEKKCLKEIKASSQYIVSDIKKSTKKVSPPLPLITSSLQQEAAKRFNWSPKKTMRVAQGLYEGVDVGKGPVGLITYMRTDSTRISASAFGSAQKYIEKSYGKEYCGNMPRTKKSSKVQDAHEAIRPTHIDYLPEKMKTHIKGDHLKLYTLIFNRYLASIMAPGSDSIQTVAVITDNAGYTFQSVISKVKFDGFRKLSRADEKENAFLQVKKDSIVKMKTLRSDAKETKAKPRFSSGTLIRLLEEKGIGRPSTYATIISTLLDRKYVESKEKALVPSELGTIVNDFLVRGFPRILDYNFTRDVENELDRIEQGELDYKELIQKNWKIVMKQLEEAKDKLESVKDKLIERVGEECPDCKGELVYRDGRYGRFISCINYPKCRYTRNIVEDSDVLCPKCGKAMEIRLGQWGKYLKCPNEKCGHSMAFTTGLKCPKCGGFIFEKISRKKKPYYICENNSSSDDSKCDFIIFTRPVEGKCSQCGSILLYPYRKKYKCPLCGNIQEDAQ